MIFKESRMNSLNVKKNKIAKRYRHDKNEKWEN